MKQHMPFNSFARSFFSSVIFTSLSSLAHAVELTDKFSFGGIIAASYQCQIIDNNAIADNTCAGAMPIQPEISVLPTPTDEFYFKFGFATGNGLNGDSPFIPAPWAADLESDVLDINGRNRDNLLSAWYKHTMQFNEHHSLDATFGIINAADYLDDNAYASDEYTQFMNAVLTNAPNVFFPSYDAGGAMEWKYKKWKVDAVVMNIGENDDGYSYTFYGAQLCLTVKTAMGEGHYRIMIDGADDKFLNVSGTQLETRNALMFNLDQELGKTIGAFVRIGWQTDKAAVDYKAIYSGGININGSAWNRGNDNIGLGYAWLEGANLDVNNSQVAEAYYRMVLNEQLALTGDIQYMNDALRNQPDPKGFIVGMRMTAEF